MAAAGSGNQTWAQSGNYMMCAINACMCHQLLSHFAYLLEIRKYVGNFIQFVIMM
jgi:hypothetical protein